MEKKKTVKDEEVRTHCPGLDRNDWAPPEERHKQFRPKIGRDSGEGAEIRQRKLEDRHRNSGQGREFLWRSKQKVL